MYTFIQQLFSSLYRHYQKIGSIYAWDGNLLSGSVEICDPFAFNGIFMSLKEIFWLTVKIEEFFLGVTKVMLETC